MSRNFLKYTNSKASLSFFIIRHGESTTNTNKKIFSSGDNGPLTTKGRNQIIKLAQRISAEGKFDYMFSSKLLRSRQSCALLAHILKINKKRIFYSNELAELDSGEWNGKLLSAMIERADQGVYRAKDSGRNSVVLVK